MKRIFAFLTAFIMLFGFCACDSGQGEKLVPERGILENGVYRNEAFGITFNGTEDLYYYSDAEIAAAMGLSKEEIIPADDKKALTEAGIIYDMYCVDMATGGSVNITYENLPATYGEAIDVSYYLELYQMEIDTMMSSGNVSVKKNESGFASIGDKMYPCINVTADLGGLNVHETIIVKKCGEWIGVITVAALDETELSKIVKNISFD